MRRVSLFTTHRFIIPFKNYKDKIYLYPIGDIHRESALCSREKFLEWCNHKREMIKKGERVYFLGMGDYSDFASVSEQVVLSNAKIHEQTIEDTFERIATENCEKLLKEMDFINKDNTIGLLEGNHYYTLKGNITTTQYVCNRIGCDYLGLSSVILLTFIRENSPKECMSLVVFAHHGRGGGRSLGGSVTHVNDMQRIFPEADIYLMGDDHKKWVHSTSRLTISRRLDFNKRPVVKNKKTLLGRTGGFLRGYVPGKSSYVAQKALPPTDIGTIQITMTPVKDEHRIGSSGGR